MIRMDTFVKLRLTCLLLNETHGPNIANNINMPILTFVLQPTDMKGGTKKVKRTAGKTNQSKTNIKISDEENYSGESKSGKRITGVIVTKIIRDAQLDL